MTRLVTIGQRMLEFAPAGVAVKTRDTEAARDSAYDRLAAADEVTLRMTEEIIDATFSDHVF